MRIQKKFHYLLFASLLMIFSSCDLSEVFDDEDDMDDPEAEIVTAKINGEAFSAVESDDALIQLDQVEGDLDLNLCMASLNYYTNDDLPHPIGVEEQPPKGGVMGELHKVALYEPPKRKSKRQTTTTVVQAVAS